MSGQCVSWMVVSSDTTRIDTEALVGDVLFLRRIREALDSQLGAAHSLNQELCAHQCGGVLQRLCALGAQLSEQIGSCADRLAYVASIHAAAEADAASYQKTVRRLGGSMAELSWAGGLTASRKIAGVGKYVNPYAPFLFAPLGIFHGIATISAHGLSFVHQPSDASLGLRTQMDVAELSRLVNGTSSRSDVEVTRDAAAQMSTLYAAMGWLMFGRHSGVRISAQSLPDGAPPGPASRVLSGVAQGGRPTQYCGSFGAVVYAVNAVAAYPPHTASPQSQVSRPQAGSKQEKVETPLKASEALERIGQLRSSADEGQIEILQHVTVDADGTEHRAWSVMIRGTQKWGPGEDNPQDMLTNLQAVGQSNSDQLRAVKTSMDMAGIKSDEPVEFVGHSQGGIIAAQLAADPQVRSHYRVASVLTAGSPVAGFHPDSSVPMLNMENTRDIVPALDGGANANRGHALTLHFDSEHLERKQGQDNPIAAHDIATYTEAIRECESADAGRYRNIEDVHRWEEERRTRLGITDATRTRSYIFDTRRVS